MALADYDTSIEKIAALKAASLDPALCNIYIDAGGEFECSQKAYMFYSFAWFDIQTGATTWSDVYVNIYSNGELSYTMLPGEHYTVSNMFFYVNDADIIYSNPVTTYQDRLAALYTTTTTMKVLTETFTAGANGSILLSCSTVNTGGKTIVGSNGTTLPLPIPAGTTVSCIGNNSYLKYFDVPADW